MIKNMTYRFLILAAILCILPSSAKAAAVSDAEAAKSKVKETLRKVVPRVINIGDINLFLPGIEASLPGPGIYAVQFNGGELQIDKDGKQSVLKTIIVTVWVYVDLLEREPGIGTAAYDQLVKNWDEKKGELVKYSVEMPPYDVAYHTSTLGKDGALPCEVSLLSPVGENFLVKISLSTNKSGMTLDSSVKLAKDLLDFIVRRSIDKEVESRENEKNDNNGKADENKEKVKDK